MGKSQETFSKKEKEKKRLKKRKEKMQKKEDRKSNSSGGDLESMIAYVDEFGNIVDTPPDPDQRTEVDAESIEIGAPKQEYNPEDDINEGKVEFFDETKNFGFIKDLHANKKYFVHRNGLIDQIQENDKVTFDLEQGMKGLNAVNVKLVK